MRAIFAWRNISARVHSTTKSVFLYLHLVLILKNAEIATSSFFCKNAWIWLVSLFYFASELKKVQLIGAEQYFWLQKLKFQCACPELKVPLANFALCAEKSGRGICPLHNVKNVFVDGSIFHMTSSFHFSIIFCFKFYYTMITRLNHVLKTCKFLLLNLAWNPIYHMFVFLCLLTS